MLHWYSARLRIQWRWSPSL